RCAKTASVFQAEGRQFESGRCITFVAAYRAESVSICGFGEPEPGLLVGVNRGQQKSAEAGLDRFPSFIVPLTASRCGLPQRDPLAPSSFIFGQPRRSNGPRRAGQGLVTPDGGDV